MTSSKSESTSSSRKRNGVPYCYHAQEVSQEELLESGSFRDNMVRFIERDRIAVLYEAPSLEKPEKGYFSVWTPRGDKQSYRKVEKHCYSGNDNDCLESFRMADATSLQL